MFLILIYIQGLKYKEELCGRFLKGFQRGWTRIRLCGLCGSSRLMHDFSCTDAKDMKYKILADRVRYFKEDEKGVATMCKAMEEMRNEAVKEERVEVARQLLELGKLSYEEIAKIAKMTIEEVKALDKKVIA